MLVQACPKELYESEVSAESSSTASVVKENSYVHAVATKEDDHTQLTIVRSQPKDVHGQANGREEVEEIVADLKNVDCNALHEQCL